MAYGCNGSTRVPWFSSPNLQYEGKATGTPTADNLRVLQQTRTSVANFRVSPAPAPPAPAPAPPAPVPPPPTPVPTRKFDYCSIVQVVVAQFVLLERTCNVV
jgi:hypothetical protein